MKAPHRLREDHGKPWEDPASVLPPSIEEIREGGRLGSRGLQKPRRGRPDTLAGQVSRKTPDGAPLLSVGSSAQQTVNPKSRYLPHLEESPQLKPSSSAPELANMKPKLGRRPEVPRRMVPAAFTNLESPFGAPSPRHTAPPNPRGGGASRMVPRSGPSPQIVRKEEMHLIAGAFLLSAQVRAHAASQLAASV